MENNLAYFIKYNRSILGLTQEDLAQRAGVGLRFIRELEQGKQTLRLDKVNQVLALFGAQVAADRSKNIDPYEIYFNHLNASVTVYLKDNTSIPGILLGPIYEAGNIQAWRFVSNNNAWEYQQTETKELERVIKHSDIIKIVNNKP